MVKPQVLTPPEAPDGGWGWVVVGVFFVASALVFGLIRSMGVFFVEFVQYFGESAQAVSWITSIGVAMQQLVTPVGTALSNAYGARPVVMVGGLLSSLGLVLASQATSLTHLYLTMGLLSGFGWALVFTPTVASVMQYFMRRRPLALGLGFTGIGLSTFAFPPLFQLLLEMYAWRGALLILGGLSLNIVACGALIRPLGGPKAVPEVQSVKLGRSCGFGGCSSLWARTSSYLELSLLSERPFLTCALAGTLLNAGYFVPYVHLVAHTLHAGFSEYQAAFIISATGVADIAGRMASGWGRLRVLHMLTAWSALLGVCVVLLPVGSAGGSYVGLLLVSLGYGFCAGAMMPLAFAIVPEIVGMQRMLGGLGLLQLIQSMGGLLGAPLSGWLKDYTGNYTASFVVAGGFLLLGCVIITTLPNFCSCTTPPPVQRQKQAQNAGLELGLLKHGLPHSSSKPEKLQHLDTIAYSEPDTEPDTEHTHNRAAELEDTQNHATEPEHRMILLSTTKTDK